MMLTAKPTNIFSWNHDVADDFGHVATASVPRFRDEVRVDLRGKTYEMRREGWLPIKPPEAYYLEERGTRVASAEKSSFLGSFEVSAPSGLFTLRAKASFLRTFRTFLLEREGRTVGTIRPAGFFSSKAIIDLPKEMRLEVQVFLTWVVLIRWQWAASIES